MSPYVHPFVKSLQTAGHCVSVVLPHEQRSWIGKAHFVGQSVTPTYFRPGTPYAYNGTTYDQPLSSATIDQEEWVLINSTPAACAQLGLFHFFQDRGPVDLVISGPNYGRNCTALYSLSSGTVGGAMEAALYRKKAVALSFAYDPTSHKPELIQSACHHSVKLIQHLYENWGEDVDLYSINVPLFKGMEDRKIMFTRLQQNYWSSGSCFKEVDVAEGDTSPAGQEQEIRQSSESEGNTISGNPMKLRHRHFKWSPRFSDVQKSIENAPLQDDGRAIKEGYTRLVVYSLVDSLQVDIS